MLLDAYILVISETQKLGFFWFLNFFFLTSQGKLFFPKRFFKSWSLV